MYFGFRINLVPFSPIGRFVTFIMCTFKICEDFCFELFAVKLKRLWLNVFFFSKSCHLPLYNCICRIWLAFPWLFFFLSATVTHPWTWDLRDHYIDLNLLRECYASSNLVLFKSSFFMYFLRNFEVIYGCVFCYHVNKQIDKLELFWIKKGARYVTR